jgi:hypothetical protein
MVYILWIILKQITDQLDLFVIPIIIYINLYLLYDCLIKLGIIKKKKLIINIITFQ